MLVVAIFLQGRKARTIGCGFRYSMLMQLRRIAYIGLVVRESKTVLELKETQTGRCVLSAHKCIETAINVLKSCLNL